MSTTDAVEAHYTHGHCWEPFLTAFRGWGNGPTPSPHRSGRVDR